MCRDFSLSIRYAGSQSADSCGTGISYIQCCLSIGHIRNDNIVNIQIVTRRSATRRSACGNPYHTARPAGSVHQRLATELHPLPTFAQATFRYGNRPLPAVLPCRILTLNADYRLPARRRGLVCRHHCPQLNTVHGILADTRPWPYLLVAVAAVIRLTAQPQAPAAVKFLRRGHDCPAAAYLLTIRIAFQRTIKPRVGDLIAQRTDVPGQRGDAF